MKCATIKNVKSKICVSDFDKRIKIQTSQKISNNAPNTISEITFTTLATLWAMIKTSPINEFINGVNVSNGTNIDFYIRYTNSIDFSQQLFIEYKNKLYAIQPVENIDEQDSIIRLRCAEKGNKSINANKR